MPNRPSQLDSINGRSVAANDQLPSLCFSATMKCTFNGVPAGAKRCQFQRVIQHLGHLRQLETGKPSVMGIAEAWRQDQTKGLTNQGSFRPAVDGLETVINFLNDSRGIGTNKGEVFLLTQCSDSIFRPGSWSRHSEEQPISM